MLENVRGHETFIIQSTCQPSNANIMELMLLADALKRSSASRITAIIPYFGYARQDRRVRSARVPISAKVVADMLNQVGIQRVLTVDLHSETIQGFFDMPADNVYATKIMVDDIKRNPSANEKLIVVSPDVGGVVRSRALAKFLDESDLAIIDKRRAAANESEVMNIIGDVEEKLALCQMILLILQEPCVMQHSLKDAGASKVKAYITHPVLSGPAIERINNSSIDELVVTNSIPLSQEAEKCSKIRVISLAPLLRSALED